VEGILGIGASECENKGVGETGSIEKIIIPKK